MPRLAAAPRPKAAESPPEQPEAQGVLTPPAEPESPPPAKKTAKKAAPAASTRTSPATREVDDLGFVELDETIDYLNVLMYGREGTAKTTGAATMANVAPEGSKVLVINAEGGLKAVALRRRGIDTSKLVVWPDPKSGVRISNKTLQSLHERILSDLMTDPNSWYGVIVDSTTDVLASLLVQAKVKRQDKMRKNGVDEADIDPDFVDRDDYGVITNQLRDLIRRFRDLPCHLVFTALERVDDKTNVIGPAISPAVTTDLMAYVDIAMYHRATLHATGEDEGEELAEFRALTRPGRLTRAKDRFDLTPRVLAEPTFERLLGYVRGTLEESDDPIQAAYVERRRQEAEAKAAAEAEKEARKAAARKGTTKSKNSAATAAGDDEDKE